MKTVSTLLLIFYFQSTSASTIADILKDVLLHAPSVIEARAESASARSRMEQTRSAHWPILTATGSKLLSQNKEVRSGFFQS